MNEPLKVRPIPPCRSFRPVNPASSLEAEQLSLEAECLERGISKYRRDVAKAKERDSEAITDYGARLVAAYVDKCATAIEQFVTQAKQRSGRRHHVVPFLEVLEPHVVSLLTMKTLVDVCSRPISLQTVAQRIGQAVMDETKYLAFERDHPRLWKVVNERIEEGSGKAGRYNRKNILDHTIRKFKLLSDPWPKTERVQVGMVLIDLVVEATGLWVIDKTAGKRGLYRLIASPTLLKFLNDYQQVAELLYPARWPMVCPPKDWEGVSGVKAGGYLTDRLRQNLTKARTKGWLKQLRQADLSSVYSALNWLQKTPWQINDSVLDIVSKAWASGLSWDTLPPQEDPEIPPRPDYEKDKEAWIIWKGISSEIFRNKVKYSAKRMQGATILAMAERFRGRPIWFPYVLDWRGRIYSSASFLQPQGCDLARGLLRFDEGKPIGEEGMWWLAVHVANCWGEDKVGFQSRVDWVSERNGVIHEMIEDPIANPWWTEADKPVQFLAACLEWVQAQKEGYGFRTRLPIWLDGSNNGCQHFSALLRDPVCGALVNLTPQEKPADIYQAVADATNALLATPEKIQDAGDPERKARNLQYADLWSKVGINRKLTKRSVMILPYGGTRTAMKEYLEETVEDEGLNHQHAFLSTWVERSRACAWLANVLWQVMDTIVVGPRTAMNWLQSVAKVYATADVPIVWKTPTGLIVQQTYYDVNKRKIKTRLGPKTIFVSIWEDLQTMDKRKHKQAFAPNFVHSLDASALMLTLNACRDEGLEFACVHDSFGTWACDTTRLSHILRREFVRMYEENDPLMDMYNRVQNLIDEAGLTEGKGRNVRRLEVPPPPPKGSLDLKSVLESEFFFA